MTRIVGLCGPAGAGKSTIAGWLEADYGARRYAFADPLKQIAMATLDLTREQCYGTQAQKETIDPRYGFHPRWFLQRLGTEGIRRVFGPDIWWRTCLEQIARDAPPVAVIEDVRFVNEAVGVRAAGGCVWLVDAPDRETSADATHASEAEWSRCPHDYAVRPKARGLAELRSIVDSAAIDQGLRRVWGPSPLHELVVAMREESVLASALTMPSIIPPKEEP